MAFTSIEMSPRSHAGPAAPAALRAMNRLAVSIGDTIGRERRRRCWSLRTLADRAGISAGHLSALEAGLPASLETYARIFTVLDMPLELAARARDGRAASLARGNDAVHAAMGEVQARRLRALGCEVAIDEPYQHYQFAGRADVVAWDRASRAMLHIENRTRFPNIQEALGSYGSKRAYLGPVIAERMGIGRGGWSSETHVIVALWSGEVCRDVRPRQSTFGAACPDGIEAFMHWWAGDRRGLPRTSSAFAFMDPAEHVREAYRFASLDRLDARTRYRDYADAARRLRS